MKKILLASVATFVLTHAAFAADITGQVELDVAENSDGKFAAATSIEFGIHAGNGSASVALAEENGSVVIDGYSVGVTVGTVGLAFGDQGDAFGSFEGGLETVGGTTLTDPNDEGESLMIAAAGATVMIGLTDVTADVTDVRNVQVSYGTVVGANVLVESGVDYNFDTEEFVLGSAVTGGLGSFGVGAITTYASETEIFSYEVSANLGGVAGFVDGDTGDALQNVGVGYKGLYQSMNYYAEASYNIDDKEITPAMGVSFNF